MRVFCQLNRFPHSSEKERKGGGEVYREQFVAGWQSTPLRFTFPRGAQRAAAAAARSQ